MGKYFSDTARHVKAQEFLELKQGTKFFLRRGECKTRENSNFWKKDKIIISVKKIRNLFCISRMTKLISPLESSREI